MPEECKDCLKLGIELQRNFHQEPVCTNPKCYERKYEEKVAREKREQEEATREWREEKAKVCEMDLDVRHWRLAVFGLISEWDRRNLLGIERDESSLEKIFELSQEACQRLLIRKAVDEILTAPERWSHEEPAKEWIVEEFGLKRELFLSEEEAKDSQTIKVPCDTCDNSTTCDRSKFYVLETGEYSCNYRERKAEKE